VSIPRIILISVLCMPTSASITRAEGPEPSGPLGPKTLLLTNNPGWLVNNQNWSPGQNRGRVAAEVATRHVSPNCGALPEDQCLAQLQVYRIYTKPTVDELLASLKTEMQQKITDVHSTISHDQEKLREDVHSDLTTQIGGVLTPDIRKEIIDEAAKQAAKQVVAALCQQGLIAGAACQ
jgi:hypothetical protein